MIHPFQQVSGRTLSVLKNIHTAAKIFDDKKRNIILIIDPKYQGPTKVKSFEYFPEAIRAYEELERAGDGLDIVLVRSKEFKFIRKAYANYFLDATDFVDCVKSGIKTLKNS